MPIKQIDKLDLNAGDTVAITAERTTYARIVPSELGNNSLGISPDIAKSIGAQADDDITIEPVSLPPLRSVVLKVLDGHIRDREVLSEALFDLPLTEGDTFSTVLPHGRSAKVSVVATDPTPAGHFNDSTQISIQSKAGERPKPQYGLIGGLSEQIAQIHEMVTVPLQRPDLFERLGVQPPRGVLFSGPPGSGKTLLARAIAEETTAAFFQINAPEIVSKHYGDSEAALRKVFSAAEKAAPAIVFIDEIDAIAPRRAGLSDEKQVERRIVAQLLTLMDGLADRGRLIVMAATNLPDSLDPALRRPGRFDREIVFKPPNATQRREILEVHLAKAPLAANADLDLIAEQANGYVGADLAALAREASLAALDRVVRDAGHEDRVNADDLFLTNPDLLSGLAATSPSALRDTMVETPAVGFSDIGGMEATKDALTEAIVWQQRHRNEIAALGIPPTTGVLLSGAPGTGKTLLARALATESGMNFIPVRPTRIMSQFLGEAERAIADVFTKARQSAPCIIFFDEFDALAPRRAGKDAVLDRIVAQLLCDMDGMARNDGIVVLAATNRAAAIDPALLRPGRFDMIIPVPLPDIGARREILKVHCAKLPIGEDVEFDSLAESTEGASGADLASIVRLAGRFALRRAMSKNAPSDARLSQSDFAEAVATLAQSKRTGTSDFISTGVQHDKL